MLMMLTSPPLPQKSIEGILLKVFNLPWKVNDKKIGLRDSPHGYFIRVSTYSDCNLSTL
jgi:hypothetical protein